jgi:hypothetical protein
MQSVSRHDVHPRDGAHSIRAGFFSGALEGWNAIDFEKQNNTK